MNYWEKSLKEKGLPPAHAVMEGYSSLSDDMPPLRLQGLLRGLSVPTPTPGSLLCMTVTWTFGSSRKVCLS